MLLKVLLNLNFYRMPRLNLVKLWDYMLKKRGSMHVASGSLILKVQFSIKNYWQNNQMNQIMLKL